MWTRLTEREREKKLGARKKASTAAERSKGVTDIDEWSDKTAASLPRSRQGLIATGR